MSAPIAAAVVSDPAAVVSDPAAVVSDPAAVAADTQVRLYLLTDDTVSSSGPPSTG